MNRWQVGTFAALVAAGGVAACSSSGAAECVVHDGMAAGPGCVADGSVHPHDATHPHDGSGSGSGTADGRAAQEASHTTARDAGHHPHKDAGKDAGEDTGLDAHRNHDSGRDAAHDSGHEARAADATPPSCTARGVGTQYCGGQADGSPVQNCCENPEVVGGMFKRHYTTGVDGGVHEAGAPATVASFRLDTYLVSVGRFRQFVNAAIPAADSGVAPWRPAAGSGKHSHLNGGLGLANSASPGTYEPGWVASDDSKIAPTDANLLCGGAATQYDTWTDHPSTNEDLPINCISWYEAYAFCIWDYGFLPSDAEYEYAAAGGARQLEYPWGSAPPGGQNQYAIYGCNYPFGNGRPLNDPLGTTCSGTESIAKVGHAPLGIGLWGQLDLAGEENEWVLDLVNTSTSACDNCAYLGPATGRAVRGGSFDVGDQQITSFYDKGEENADQRSFEVGFRCARLP